VTWVSPALDLFSCRKPDELAPSAVIRDAVRFTELRLVVRIESLRSKLTNEGQLGAHGDGRGRQNQAVIDIGAAHRGVARHRAEGVTAEIVVGNDPPKRLDVHHEPLGWIIVQFHMTRDHLREVVDPPAEPIVRVRPRVDFL
jgi:hypothetical protein